MIPRDATLVVLGALLGSVFSRALTPTPAVAAVLVAALAIATLTSLRERP